MSEVTSLWALFGSAFLSATVLPLPSEGALIAFERAFPNGIWIGVLFATVGNTLGGFTTYVLGRFSGRYLPETGQFAPQVLQSLKRFGAFSLVFSWLPIVGDLLCGVAGWLRLSWWLCAIWMFIGKGARYALLAFFL